jgi:hypothetical protein
LRYNKNISEQTAQSAGIRKAMVDKTQVRAVRVQRREREEIPDSLSVDDVD